MKVAFLQGASNFLQGASNFLQGASNCLQGASNFLQGASNFCKVRRIFPWQERKRSEMKVAEEYCWVISEATRRSFCGR